MQPTLDSVFPLEERKYGTRVADLYTILFCHHLSMISGGETSLLELFRHLDRSRFRPILAAPGNGPFANAARDLDVEVFPVEFGRLRRIGRLLKSVRNLRAIARKSGADILHGNGPVTNIPATLAAHMSGLPVIWHARTMLVPREIDLDRLLSPFTSLIIANSDAIRNRFRGRSGKKCITIINGVDIHRFHPLVSDGFIRQELKLKPECILVGVVGRIAPVKGQRTFIEAAAYLIPRYPNLRFILVGGGLFQDEQEYERDLRNVVKEQNFDDRIFFIGHERDVRPYLAAMDICVVPSESEGCSRVIFEAMALGKPVVGTNTGGTPEVIEDGNTGILIPPRDTLALAEAVRRLAEDKILRMQMGTSGRQRVENHFTIETNVRKTESAYLRLLGRRSGNA